MKKNHSSLKGDGRRVSRFENEIQSIVSLYIIHNLQSQLPGLVTVGRVHVPADLRTAHVYISLLNLSDEKDGQQKLQDLENTLDILQREAKEMQFQISQKVQMKYLPKLTFFADESTNKILKIEKLLSEIGTSADVSNHIDDED